MSKRFNLWLDALIARSELTLYCKYQTALKELGLPRKTIDERSNEAWKIAKRIYKYNY